MALAALVEDALTSQAAELRATGAVVEVADDLPTLHGEAGQLAHVVTNLVSNALKYADGTPRIEIDAERADDILTRATRQPTSDARH